MSTNPVSVSLFCGAGGESLGKSLAFDSLGIKHEDVDTLAMNHWDLAIAVHGRNMPWIRVVRDDIEKVRATDFGIKRINLLWASPSCVHFSKARGGMPVSDQQRSHATDVINNWLKIVQVDVLLVENVREFKDWGPIYVTHSDDCNGDHSVDESLSEEEQDARRKVIQKCHYSKPIVKRRGEFFRRFVSDLKALGYEVDWRILCSADYGDPTTRERFFLQAVRDGRGIHWPKASHCDPKKIGTDMFCAGLKPWRTASECIDWSLDCPSIFDRTKPLAAATQARIAAGIQKYVLSGHPFIVRTDMHKSNAGCVYGTDEPLRTVTTAGGLGVVTPYLVNMRGTEPGQVQGSSSSLEEPLRTMSAGGRHAALVTPYMVNLTHGSRLEDLDRPMTTVTGARRGEKAIIAASLIQTGYGEREGQDPRTLDLEKPLGTVVANGTKHALVAAFLARNFGGPNGNMAIGADLTNPAPTLTSRDQTSLVAANLITIDQQSTGASALRPVDAPLSTTVTKARHAIVAATLMTNNSNNAPHDPSEPLATVTTGDRHYLVSAFLHHHYTTGTTSQPVTVPMHTVTTKERHSLVTVLIEGVTYAIMDIGMRMLQPHELAKATGFPDDFEWSGSDGRPITKTDQVKMIGNAVTIGLAKALVRAVVEVRLDVFRIAA